MLLLLPGCLLTYKHEQVWAFKRQLRLINRMASWSKCHIDLAFLFMNVFKQLMQYEFALILRISGENLSGIQMNWQVLYDTSRISKGGTNTEPCWMYLKPLKLRYLLLWCVLTMSCHTECHNIIINDVEREERPDQSTTRKPKFSSCCSVTN